MTLIWMNLEFKKATALLLHYFIQKSSTKRWYFNIVEFFIYGANEVVIYNFFDSLDDWYKNQSNYNYINKLLNKNQVVIFIFY